MSRYNTNNPVPSNEVKDFSDNAKIVDEIVHLQQPTTIDRFGENIKTWYGIQQDANEAIAQYGYITMDSFQDGATLTLPNQVLRWALPDGDGEYYRWDGVFPKTVPADSTPETTGGIGPGAWLGVGDAVFRADIAAQDGESYIGGATYAQIRSSNVTGDEIKCIGRSAKRDGGEGWFFLDEADTTTADDDGTVLIDASNRRWKRAFDGSKKAAWFGVKDGVDAAAALQAAVNTGGKIEVKDGQYPVSGRINVDTTGALFPSLGRKSKRFDLIGTSPHETTFLPAGNFLRYIGNDYTAPGQGQLSWMQFKNFCIFPTTSGNPVGTGLDIRDCISTNIETVLVRKMDTGITLSGALSGQVNNCGIDRNRIGIYLEHGNFSPINNVNFIGDKIASNYEFAVRGEIGTRVTFEQSSFESNGWSLDESGGTESTGCIDLSIIEPMGVMTFKDCYFEANEGLADIIIRNNTPNGAPVIVNFIGCKFGRGNSRGKGTKFVIQTFSPSGASIIFNFMGCQFYVQTASGFTPGTSDYYIPNKSYLYCSGLDTCYYSHQQWVDPALNSRSLSTGLSVSSSGAILTGPNGMTATKTSTGTYRFTSTSNLGPDKDSYQVVASTPQSGNLIAHVTKVSSSIFDVIITNTSGTSVDSMFDAIIIKPKARFGV
jgi:hypothetical protein